MPAINQEINVIINALVRKLQDVRELNKEIKTLKSSDQQPVIIDEKISANAKAGAGDVRQLQTSIEGLSAAITKMDGQSLGRLARLATVLGGIATVLGHLKGTQEGIGVIKNLATSSPALNAKLSQTGTALTNAGTAVRGFFAAAREKGANALSSVKDTVGGLAKNLPGLTAGALGAAGGLAAIGLTAGVAAVALAGIVAVIAAIVAVPAIIGILIALAKGAADAGAEFHDLSQESAVSVETLSSLKPAIEQSGESLENVAGMIGKFNKLIGEAASGSDEATAKLKRFGIEPQEGLENQEAALEKVFKRIHELPTPIEKAIASQNAFGKSGAAMVKVIDSAGGSLEKAKERAKEFGYLLSTQAAKDADEFGDQVDELTRILKSFGLAIGREVIPAILQLLRIMVNEAPVAGGAFAGVLRFIGETAQNTTLGIIGLIAAIRTLDKVGQAAKAAAAVAVITGSAAQGAAAARDVLEKEFSDEANRLLAIAFKAAPSTPKGPNLDLGNKGKGGSKRSTAAADTIDAELDRQRAAAQKEFNLEKDLIDRLTEIRKTALDDHKIRIEDFYEQTEELRQRELAAELRLNRTLIQLEKDRRDAEIKKINADKETTPGQKAALKLNANNSFVTATAQLDEQFKRLTRDAVDLPATIAAAAGSALESLDSQITEFLSRVDEANGRTAHAAAEAIDREFKDLLERVTIEQGENSPLVQLIKEFVQLQKDRARVAQIDQQLEPLGQQFELDRLEIETQVSRNVITQREGRREINALQKTYLQAQLEILKNELANTKEARTQLEIKLRIAGIQKAIADLDNEIDETAKHINDSLRFAFEDFFSSLFDRTKTFKEAIADLGRSILQMFSRLIAQKLVERLFGSLLGNNQGNGGIGGIFTGVFGGPKAAGDVLTARPGGQLIQVAEAGFDELVVSTDPRYSSRTSALLGNFIRRTGILPDLSRFAAGGFARSFANSFANIPRLAAGAFVTAGPTLPGDHFGSSRQPPPKVVIAVSPDELANASMSSAGEKVWIHHFNANRRALGL
jgi:hypothetical protein